MPDQQEFPGPDRWTRAHAQDAIYVAALVFCGLNALIYVGWIFVDVPARFFGVHGSWLGNDWRTYLAGPVAFDGWMLYVEAALSAVAVVGVLLRRRWALLALGLALISGTSHWAFDTGNPHFGTGFAGTYVYVHAAVFLIAIGLVAMNWSWGGLTAAPAHASGKRRRPPLDASEVEAMIGRATLVIIILNAMMHLFWTWIRLSAELFGITSAWLGADMVAYTDSQGFAGHVIFYTAVLLSCSLVWLFWQRSILAVYVLIADVLVSTADWVISSLDARAPGGPTDTLSYIQVLLFALIFAFTMHLLMRGYFRGVRRARQG